MISLIKKIFGTANDRIVKKLRNEVLAINELELYVSKLSDTELSNKTIEFKQKLNEQNFSLDAILYEAFAVVREAAKRTLNMRHFDVQLMGGLLLHRGTVAEMRTGEGKTLAATLPAYLNSLTGLGVHVVTANDYLAKRDAKSMSKLYNFLGVSVGCVTGNMSEKERRDAYNMDITHASNNELAFDFLRDNMRYSQESKVQRTFNFAIVDEIDSIFIDEARTPLIISGPVEDNCQLYSQTDKLVSMIKPDDYEKDEKLRTVNLTEEGINHIESLLITNNMLNKHSSLYDVENLSLVHHINQSLKAHILFKLNVDYLIRDGKIMIIDEFTGRVIEGRRYSDGLHQALEAKEGVTIQNENQTLASITFQNYFRIYEKLSGMTGTAMTESAELKHIYNLDVVAIPTHNPMIRIDCDDEIYGNIKDKSDAIIKLIKRCYDTGQPVLIGTISIEKSEEISTLLTKHKVQHNVLNAKFHEKEAYIIAQAGKYKAVTIATNMAGRGTDIMLGGNPDMLIEQLDLNQLTNQQYEKAVQKIRQQVEEEKQRVIEAGGLCIIGTERHESRRIDNQLRGRSGRQGDPGITKFFLSLEDDLMRIFASDRISGILRKLGLKGGDAIHHPMISKSLEKAQQKVESHNYEIRKNLLNFDDVMNEQRRIIYQQRNDIINSEDSESFFDNMLQQLADDTVMKFIKPGSYREEWDLDGLCQEVYRIFSTKLDSNAILSNDGTEVEIVNQVIEMSKNLYKEKSSLYGSNIMHDATKYILLTTLDQIWKDHLHSLDHLRQGISLRAYGQKDPLNEYKREAFNLFANLLHSLKELFIQRMSYLHIDISKIDQESISLKNKKLHKTQETRQDPALNKYNPGSSLETKLKSIKAYVDPQDRDPNKPSTWGKISRNEICPCNSGKKYKHCHGMM